MDDSRRTGHEDKSLFFLLTDEFCIRFENVQTF